MHKNEQRGTRNHCTFGRILFQIIYFISATHLNVCTRSTELPGEQEHHRAYIGGQNGQDIKRTWYVTPPGETILSLLQWRARFDTAIFYTAFYQLWSNQKFVICMTYLFKLDILALYPKFNTAIFYSDFINFDPIKNVVMCLTYWFKLYALCTLPEVQHGNILQAFYQLWSNQRYFNVHVLFVETACAVHFVRMVILLSRICKIWQITGTWYSCATGMDSGHGGCVQCFERWFWISKHVWN